MKQYLLAGASVLALTRVASAGPVTFDYTGAVVDYTVPTTGLYDIVAAGAQGGANGGGTPGGNGAVIGGAFSLTAGDTLVVAVGGQGDTGQALFRSYFGGGGGGGSFVVDQTTSTKLVIAGGGGGGYELSGEGGITGHGGSGGGGNTFSLGSGGGGGYSGNGSGQSGGKGFPNLAGGQAYFSEGVNGGFGGGGGSGANGAGGGGGYSGGNASGGGGGSYDSGKDQTLAGGVQAGDGYVTLTRASVPEPAALGLFGMALAGLGASRRRVRR